MLFFLLASLLFLLLCCFLFLLLLGLLFFVLFFLLRFSLFMVNPQLAQQKQEEQDKEERRWSEAWNWCWYDKPETAKFVTHARPCVSYPDLKKAMGRFLAKVELDKVQESEACEETSKNGDVSVRVFYTVHGRVSVLDHIKTAFFLGFRVEFNRAKPQRTKYQL